MEALACTGGTHARSDSTGPSGYYVGSAAALLPCPCNRPVVFALIALSASALPRVCELDASIHHGPVIVFQANVSLSRVVSIGMRGYHNNIQKTIPEEKETNSNRPLAKVTRGCGAMLITAILHWGAPPAL